MSLSLTRDKHISMMIHRKTRSENFNFLPGSSGSSVPAEGMSQETTTSCSMDTDRAEHQETCEVEVAEAKLPRSADRARPGAKNSSMTAISHSERVSADANAPTVTAKPLATTGWTDGLPPGLQAGGALSHNDHLRDLPRCSESHHNESNTSLVSNQTVWPQPSAGLLVASPFTACSSEWVTAGVSFPAGGPAASLLLGQPTHALPFAAQPLPYGHVRSLSHGFIDMKQQQQQLATCRLSLGAPGSLPDLVLPPLPTLATVPSNRSVGYGSHADLGKAIPAAEAALVAAGGPAAMGFDLAGRGRGNGSAMGDIGAATATLGVGRDRHVSESGRGAAGGGVGRSRARTGKALAGGGSAAGEGRDALESAARGGGGGREKTRAGNGKTSRELLLLDPKRVKRIIANRMSAAKSKERKQQYTEQLVQMLDNSSAEREALRRQHERLMMDGAALEGHILQLGQETQRLASQLAAVRQRGEALLRRLWDARVAAGQQPSQPMVDGTAVEATVAAAGLLPNVVGLLKEGLSTEDLEALKNAGCAGGVLPPSPPLQQPHIAGPQPGSATPAPGAVVMTASAGGIGAGAVPPVSSTSVGLTVLQGISPGMLPLLSSQQDLAHAQSLLIHAQQQQQQQPPAARHPAPGANGSLSMFPITQPPLQQHNQQQQQQRPKTPQLGVSLPSAALHQTTNASGTGRGPAAVGVDAGSAGGLPVAVGPPPGYHRPSQSADAATMMRLASQVGTLGALGPGMPNDMAPGHRLLDGGGCAHGMGSAGAGAGPGGLLGLGSGRDVGLVVGAGVDPAVMAAVNTSGGFSLSLPGPIDIARHRAAADALAAMEAQVQPLASLATAPSADLGMGCMVPAAQAGCGPVAAGAGGDAMAMDISLDLGLSRLGMGVGMSGGLGMLHPATGGLAVPCALGCDTGLLAGTGGFMPGGAGAGVGLSLLGDPAGLQSALPHPHTFPGRQVTTALRPPVTTDSWRP